MSQYITNEVLFQRFEVIRKESGLLQQDFAKEIKLSKQAYTNIKQNRRNVNIEELFFICKKFQVNSNWLLLGSGDIFLNRISHNQVLDLIEEINKYFVDERFSEKILLEKVFEKIIQKLHQNTLFTKMIGENKTPIKFLLKVLAYDVQKESYSRLDFLNQIEKIKDEKKQNKKKLKKIIENLSEEELFFITKYRIEFISIYLSKLDFTDKVFFKEFKEWF